MSLAIDGPHDAPDVIVPPITPKKGISDNAKGRVQALVKALTTREGLLGDYNYGMGWNLCKYSALSLR
jgi:hypothetical protein